MDALKLHLILNYYPAIGLFIGALMMIGGFWRRSDRLKRAAMKVFLVIAVFAFPVYVAGEIAAASDGAYTGATESLNLHKGFARPAFLLIELTGLAAIVGLVAARRCHHALRWTSPAILLLAVITCGVVLTTVYLGRQAKWAATPAVQAGR